jgi:hypothetical protein
MKKTIIIALVLLTLSAPLTRLCTPDRNPLTSVPGNITHFDEEYIQFKSLDGSVMWHLTRDEAHVTPNTNDIFVLTYDDHGTTSCWHHDCECYFYDDEFIMIEKA